MALRFKPFLSTAGVSTLVTPLNVTSGELDVWSLCNTGATQGRDEISVQFNLATGTGEWNIQATLDGTNYIIVQATITASGIYRLGMASKLKIVKVSGSGTYSAGVLG